MHHTTGVLLTLFCALLATGQVRADELTLHQRIDQKINQGLEKWDLVAAPQCSDADFVRRIHLDLTGCIPSAQVARSFIASDDSDKREQLIDQLLASDGFAQHMAVVFDVMLMERRPDKYVTAPNWRKYLSNSFAANKPLDVLTREILTADGIDDASLHSAAKFYLDRAVDKDVLVRDIGRLFLGVNLQCAQCHDHPDIDDYLHQHYHGLSVFVAGSKIFKQPDGTVVLQELVTREVEFVSVFDPETTNKTGPRLIDALLDVPATKDDDAYLEKPSSKVRAVPRFSLRKLLAEKLSSDETPEFSRNMANRLWAHMMGRGLVHPLDMHHADNPPSHPELLQLLTSELRKRRFDTKAFLRELALSDTYHRASFVSEGVDPSTIPVESYAVANMKGLSPEQLYHSLVQATGAQPLIAARIEAELKQDEASYQELLADEEKLVAARKALKKAQLDEFVAMFGSPVGAPVGEFQASLPQALFLANSELVNSWVAPEAQNLTQRLAELSEIDRVTEEAYLSVLSRLPGDVERQLAAEHFKTRGAERPKAVLELVWSLLASAEFRLNH